MEFPRAADLQRWSRDVARDPASPSFVPLARAYRRQGLHEAAIRVCLRALERQPEHVEGHVLLGALYLETGDLERASDEWSIVLRLEPDHFDAHRGLGFFYLERGDPEDAERHLSRAAQLRPEDPAVAEALRLARERRAAGADRRPVHRDPTAVFGPLEEDAAFQGAFVVDGQGLVLAGSLKEGGAGRAVRLGAILGETLAEAIRMVEHLSLGGWEGVLLRTEQSTVQVSPLGREWSLVVVAAPDAPDGWLRRTTSQAAELARAYLADNHE